MGTYLWPRSPLSLGEEAQMQAKRDQGHGRHEVLVQVILLGLLALIAVSMALLALVVPDVNIELPVTPTFTDFPISPHAGF